MKPSTSQLIESARLALEEHVAPEAKADLAASAVRSVNMILKHLAVRAEREGEILWQENVELKQLMTELATMVKDMQQPVGIDTVEKFERTIASSEVDAADYPSIAMLDEENATLRLQLDDLLNAVLSQPEDHGDRETLISIRAKIRAHLDAQMLRERDLYFPVFVGPPV